MRFRIRLGIPDFKKMWDELADKYKKNALNGEESKLFKKIGKTMKLLSENPKHNSLYSHEIYELSKEYGIKIFQSYTENKTPSAGRLFWAYGPDKGDITILAYSPHPDDTKGAYKRISLSGLPISDNEE